MGGTPAAGARITAVDTAWSTPLKELRCPEQPEWTVLDYQCRRQEQHLVELAEELQAGAVPSTVVTADSDGGFRVAAAPGRTYRLWVAHPNGVARVLAAAEQPVEVELDAGVVLEGEVKTHDEPFVVGAPVVAIPSSGDVAFTAWSGDAGQYRFAAVPKDDYAFVCVTPGYVPAAEASDPDFMLSRPRRILGTVKGARPVEPVRLEAGWPEIETTADSHGHFEIDGLSWGSHTVTARQGDWIGFAEVDLRTAREVTVTIELKPQATVRGLALEEGTGAPVAGAEVEIYDSLDQVRLKTDASGAFTARAPAGQISISAKGPGHRPTVEDLTRELGPGEVAEVVLRLKKGVPFSGRVVDEHGGPVAGVWVSLDIWDVPDEPPQISDVIRALRATTDADGGFVFDDSGAGKYLLDVMGLFERDLVSDAPSPIELPHQPVVITLHRPVEGDAEVSGIVVDGDGAPAEDVQVHVDVDRKYRELWARTDASGHFLLEHVPAGDWPLRASWHMGMKVSARVRVRPRSRQEVTLRMPRVVAVSGRVVDAPGAPMGGVNVRAYCPNPYGQLRYCREADVDDRGGFVFNRLPEKPMKIFAVDEDRDLRSESVDVRGAASGLTLTLRPTPRLRGRYVRASGAPIEHFTVDGERINAVDGRFDVKKPVVETTIAFASEDRRIRVVPVPASGEEMGDVIAPNGEPIRGEIRDADTGAPIPGVFVVQAEDVDPPWHAYSGMDGRFQIGPIAPHPSKLILSRIGYPDLEVPLGDPGQFLQITMRREKK